jgi:hypothetical protein
MTVIQADAGSRLAGVRVKSPSTAVTMTAIMGTLALLAFAAVNIIFEGTNHFADGPLAAYVSGLLIMNWLVVGLKLLGAVVLVLSVSRWASGSAPNLMTLLLWGAFATFAIYALGTIGEAVAMATGLAGSPDEIDAASVAYLVGTVFFATCFGVVAVSYSRRAGWRPLSMVVGLLGAPILLVGLLVLVPTLLVSIGIMPPM